MADWIDDAVAAVRAFHNGEISEGAADARLHVAWRSKPAHGRPLEPGFLNEVVAMVRDGVIDVHDALEVTWRARFDP